MNVPVERIIELSELRIGNYLEYEGQIVHVTSMSLDIDDEYEDIIGFCKLGSFNNEYAAWNRALADKLNRIPISPEWLIKFGFDNESPNDDAIVYCLNYGGQNFYVDWTTLQPIDLGFPILNRNIEFIHQLQNLYFVWTGLELQVKKR